VSAAAHHFLYSLSLSHVYYIDVYLLLLISLLFSSLFVSSGQKSIRPYWRNYYDQTDALVNNALHSTLFYSVLFCSICSPDRTDALVLHSMRFILFYCVVFDFILLYSPLLALHSVYFMLYHCILHYSLLSAPIQ
jgi:ADP-ribosylation factor family